MSADDARLLGDDPRGLFGTARKMFAVPYEEIRELQLAALRQRFRSLRPQIQLLDRLAKRNAVDDVASIADGARLLYPSNVYKSYPFGWLVDQEYARLTNWLRQLTAHDLSGVDVDGVDSLDEWFMRLEASSDLRLCHSSSTSGKLSFVPRGVDEWMRRSGTLPFGYEAAGNDDGPQHVSFESLPFISTFYRSGHSAILMHTEWFIRTLTDPDGAHPERVLTLHPGALSSDLMVLAGRLRSGSAHWRSHARCSFPNACSSRRAELGALLEGTTGERIDHLRRRSGRPLRRAALLIGGVWPSMVDAAEAALRLGLRDVFDPPRSSCPAGARRAATSPGTRATWCSTGPARQRLQEGYGMSELMGIQREVLGRQLPPQPVARALRARPRRRSSRSPPSAAPPAGSPGSTSWRAPTGVGSSAPTSSRSSGTRGVRASRQGPYLDPRDPTRPQRRGRQDLVRGHPPGPRRAIEFLRAQGA